MNHIHKSVMYGSLIEVNYPASMPYILVANTIGKSPPTSAQSFYAQYHRPIFIRLTKQTACCLPATQLQQCLGLKPLSALTSMKNIAATEITTIRRGEGGGNVWASMPRHGFFSNGDWPPGASLVRRIKSANNRDISPLKGVSTL